MDYVKPRNYRIAQPRIEPGASWQETEVPFTFHLGSTDF